MTTPLFSTYSQGENRVTATFLAVLERLSVANMNRILGALLNEREQDFSLVTFVNQPKGIDSVPDARIETGHGLWIETKTATNAVGLRQIRNHMKAVRGDEKLLVLTPDDYKPAVLDNPPLAKASRDRIVWANFSKLDGVITEILEDKESPPSGFEAFLLREFSAFLQHEELTITAKDRVMVASAGWAWPVYNAMGKVMEPFRSGYRGGAGGKWKRSDHIAFYTGNEIKTIVPKVKSVIETINITEQEEIDALKDEHQRQLANDLLERMKRCEAVEQFNAEEMIIFLSSPDDTETITLPNPIENDKIGKHGKRVPLMQGGARYVTKESLLKARKTSDLIFC